MSLRSMRPALFYLLLFILDGYISYSSIGFRYLIARCTSNSTGSSSQSSMSMNSPVISVLAI